MITEHFIQFIWQHRLFDTNALKTVQNESVTLIKSGFLNQYDGPDFSDARIRIGAIEWFGTVELHLKDIDWIKHGHQNDSKYRNVILHVVWEINNEDTVPKDIPCLILKNYVSEKLISSYQELLSNSKDIACSNSIDTIRSIDKDFTISEKSFERLKRKATLHLNTLKAISFDWHQFLFYLFATSLGKKANKSAMELLANNIKFKHLVKHSDQEESIEALLYGTAGLLENSKSTYQNELLAEFNFLKEKYSITQINNESWNFSKVLGSGKPHLSIAILSSISVYISNIKDINLIDDTFLNQLKLSNYWKEHYDFDKKSKFNNTITQDLTDHLKINVIAPYLSVLGIYYNDDSYFYKAQSILETIKAEKNSIISKMNSYGFTSKDAFSSQGAIELHNEYCLKKRCLECNAGKTILSKS